MATVNFNSSEHKDPGFDPLPEGKYLVVVESSEDKPTKKGDGTGLSFKLQVIDGEFKGRTMFWWMNYNNPNETAQKIGRAELAMLCRAVGVLMPKDTMELHNIPFTAHIVVTPARGEYDAGNKVKKAEPKSAYAEQPVAAVGGKAPWEK